MGTTFGTSAKAAAPSTMNASTAGDGKSFDEFKHIVRCPDGGFYPVASIPMEVRAQALCRALDYVQWLDSKVTLQSEGIGAWLRSDSAFAAWSKSEQVDAAWVPESEYDPKDWQWDTGTEVFAVAEMSNAQLGQALCSVSVLQQRVLQLCHSIQFSRHG